MTTPSLLETISFDDTIKQTRRGAAAPLLMEFEVNPDLAPFLVSSTRAVQWVSHASQAGMVRAAVRKRQQMESDIVAAVVSMGREAEWGNVHDLTTEGVRSCVEHLREYGLEQIEILLASDTDVEGIDLPKGVVILETEWLPQDALVVVPADRGYLGTLGTIGRHKAVAIVHNPSRGIAVAWR
jgi:hypothetical protein